MEIFFLFLVSISLVAGAPGPPEVDKFALGNQKFTADIYREVAKIEKGNFMISPLSLEIAFALVAVGAKGQTGEEIRKGFYFTDNQTEVNEEVYEVIQTLKSSRNATVSTANRLFIRQGFHIQNSYRNVASRYYNAGGENLDFNNPEKSADLINKWVEQQTNDKIKNLTDPKDITEDLVLVIVNTLYLHAYWLRKFQTIPGTQLFYGADGKSVPVNMMTTKTYYNYSESHEFDCKILELTYYESELSMVIALPNQKDGLAKLEAHIGELATYNNFTNSYVDVTLPKFTTETRILFKPILEKLGIRKVFTPAADLTGIAPGLEVSKVIQKTFINVTEDGTEAAAATEGQALTLAIQVPEPPDVIFRADHPFLYSIVRRSTRVALFTGRVVTI